LWRNIEKNIEEVKKNPMLADDYLDIYADYREIYP
jgi:hypothetical protein